MRKYLWIAGLCFSLTCQAASCHPSTHQRRLIYYILHANFNPNPFRSPAAKKLYCPHLTPWEFAQ